MNCWTEDAIGLDPDAGDVGGDIQMTKSASRRFVKQNDDGTYGVVTVYAYGTEEEHGGLDVQEMVEFITCRDLDDPGSTEISSDYQYRHPFDFAPSSLDMAEVWARNYVRMFDIAHVSWDGQAL